MSLSLPLTTVWALVRGLKLIAPLSAAHVALLLLLPRRWTSSSSRVSLLLLAEFLFYLWCELVRARAQVYNERPIVLSSAQRMLLLRRCLATSGKSPEEFISAWFHHVEFERIGRGNIQEWLAFGLFHRQNWELMPENEKQELEVVITTMENFVAQKTEGFKFKEFYNPEVRPIRFPFEPVESSHRPLALYFLIHFLIQVVITPMYLRAKGFSRGTCGNLVFWHFYNNTSREGGNKAPPLVLLHGIGIGLLPYVSFINRLLEDMQSGKLPKQDLILIEVAAISQQLHPPELHRDEFVDEVKQYLNETGYSKAHFIGHSFGTFCVTWLLYRAPECIASTLLLDPVCFCLHHAKGVHSILYKKQETMADEIFHYLLRGELFFNVQMRRFFFWYCNVLFFEEIPCPTFVMVSEEDEVAPAEAIIDYVQKYNAGESPCKGLEFDEEANLTEGGGKPENPVGFLLLKNGHHGEFLRNSKFMDAVMNQIGVHLRFLEAQ